MFRAAIIGRPNVGKSTLFNRLSRSRRAIVGNEPGMTRDRLYRRVEWGGKIFEVIDTGGMIPRQEELMPKKIFQHAELAIKESDLILFMVDARAGITPLDEELVKYLRSQQKEIILVANKIDTPTIIPEANQFYKFGLDEVYPISAEHGLGVADLLEGITKRVPDGHLSLGESEQSRAIKVAIVGRPNVGKSMLVNRLLGQERLIVSDIPGTTRDAIDSMLTYDAQSFTLIDTAGIRRKGKTKTMAEKLSVIMARKHLERADVAVVVMDATEAATKLDATIGGYAHEAGCSVILALNKWDLVQKEKNTLKDLTARVRFRAKFLEYAPILTISALTGARVLKLLDFAKHAYEARMKRIPTSILNEFFNSEIKDRVMTANPNRKFEVKYLTQIKVSPPTFVLFTSTQGRLHFSIERFILNRLRERFGFYATPIRLIQRGKKTRRKV